MKYFADYHKRPRIFPGNFSWPQIRPARICGLAALAAVSFGMPQFAEADGSSSPPAMSLQDRQAGYDDYVAQLPALLAHPDAQLPPDAAKASGKALVTVELAANGRVLSTVISKSSGNPAIDEFALEDVGQAHYPAFNARMPYKSFQFILPVTVMSQVPSATYAPSSSGSASSAWNP